MFTSCASTTMIHSIPSGARLYIDDQPVGNTPFLLRNTKIVGSKTNLRLVKTGYEEIITSIYKNEKVDAGALIGGILVGVPFLWIMEYKPMHYYELTPFEIIQNNANENANPIDDSKNLRIKELTILLEEKKITKEEYDLLIGKIIQQDIMEQEEISKQYIEEEELKNKKEEKGDDLYYIP